MTELVETEASVTTPSENPQSPPRSRFGWLWVGPGAILAWWIGAMMSTSLFTGVFAMGFVFRWMGRTAERVWWRQSAREQAFDVAIPRWVFSSQRGGRGWIGGAWDNIKLGAVGAITSFAALLPSATLWMFAWRYGWDNSFTKGYDLRWIGPSLGLLGIASFAVTMLVLPLAQARYAQTRSWRAFFDVGVLGTLLKRSWTGAVPLAAAYALVGIPFTLMWMIPVFAPVNNPEFATFGPAEYREWLDGYYFAWALLGFPVYFGLKHLAARWYGNALLDAVRAGALTRRQLHVAEAEALDRYGLLKVKDLSHRHPLVRAADWTASAVGRSAGLGFALFLWAFVAFQVFVGAFFHYRPMVGWMNQPLVLVPAFKYVPPGLRDVEE